MPPLRCPICDTLVDPEISLRVPFCSIRCQQLDLSRWLNEEYSIAGVPDPEDDEVDSPEFPQPEEE